MNGFGSLPRMTLSACHTRGASHLINGAYLRHIYAALMWDWVQLLSGAFWKKGTFKTRSNMFKLRQIWGSCLKEVKSADGVPYLSMKSSASAIAAFLLGSSFINTILSCLVF